MRTLELKTRNNLEFLLGIGLSELEPFDVNEEISYIEKRMSSKIQFSRKKDTRKIGRGNPLLARKRFRTMDEVNKRLDKLKWR